jgi:hypothetical protein
VRALLAQDWPPLEAYLELGSAVKAVVKEETSFPISIYAVSRGAERHPMVVLAIACLVAFWPLAQPRIAARASAARAHLAVRW